MSVFFTHGVDLFFKFQIVFLSFGAKHLGDIANANLLSSHVYFLSFILALVAQCVPALVAQCAPALVAQCAPALVAQCVKGLLPR
jgi:hypothetical protein